MHGQNHIKLVYYLVWNSENESILSSTSFLFQNAAFIIVCGTVSSLSHYSFQFRFSLSELQHFYMFLSEEANLWWIYF